MAAEKPIDVGLRVQNRLATMKREFARRRETLAGFGIGLPADAAPPEAPARVLFAGPPSTEFTTIEQALSTGDVEVIAAFTRDTAFEYLDRGGFDVLILNGADEAGAVIAILDQVRRDTRYFHLPVLFLAGSDASSDLEEHIARGSTQLLVPPLSAETVRDLADVLIRGYRQHRHLSVLYRENRPPEIFDAETGLYHRDYLASHLDNQIRADDMTALSLAFLEIKNLPRVIDELGADAGDILLRQIGSMIGRLFRGEDLCACYDRGQFIVIMPDTPADGATSAVRRLVASVQTTQFQLADGQPPGNFYLTQGLATLDHGDTAQTLIDRARKLARP